MNLYSVFGYFDWVKYNEDRLERLKLSKGYDMFQTRHAWRDGEIIVLPPLMQRELGTPQPNAVTKDGRVYLTDGVSIKISLVDSRAYNTTGLAPEDGFIIRLPFARSGYLPYRGLPGFRRREPYYEFVALFKFDAARLHPYNGLAKYKEYIKEGRWYREAIIYEKEIVVSGADDNDFCFRPGDYEILTKFKALLYEAIQEEYYGPVAAYWYDTETAVYKDGPRWLIDSPWHVVEWEGMDPETQRCRALSRQVTLKFFLDEIRAIGRSLNSAVN